MKVSFCEMGVLSVKRKYFIIFILVLSLIISAGAAYAYSFNDLDGHWAAYYIERLAAEGIINGYPDGLVRPEDLVQVDEFVKMLITAMGYDLANGEDYWASTYFEKARQNRMIEWGDFSLDDYTRKITRGEMALLISRVADEKVSNLDKYGGQFSDLRGINHVDRSAILTCYALGIITGYPDDTFRPYDTATRAEAAAMIVRLMDKAERILPGSGLSNPAQPSRTTAYEMIKTALLHVEPEVNLSQLGISLDALKNTMDKVIKDYPEIFYYKGLTYSGGWIEFKYTDIPRDELIKMQVELQQTVDTIISNNVASGMSNYDNEKALHDYLVLNTKYDQDNYVKGTVPDLSYTAYGALVKGTAVCEGYATAMQILLREAGVESEIISGLSDGQGHAWNLVKLGESYYHLDATWDDPVPDQDGQVQYNYFNLSDDMIKHDHSWDDSEYPEAEKIDYNYFVMNDLYMEDADEFKDYLHDAFTGGQDEVMAMIKDYHPSQQQVGQIIRNVISDFHVNVSYSYSYNKELGIIKVVFDRS